jgi:hypothetical protein
MWAVGRASGMLHALLLCYVVLCYVMLCCVMLCCVVLCCVVLCCVVLCHVVLCCVVLCCVVLCCVVLCCVEHEECGGCGLWEGHQACYTVLCSPLVANPSRVHGYCVTLSYAMSLTLMTSYSTKWFKDHGADILCVEVHPSHSTT